jgi:hypothetical protein
MVQHAKREANAGAHSLAQRALNRQERGLLRFGDPRGVGCSIVAEAASGGNSYNCNIILHLGN